MPQIRLNLLNYQLQALSKMGIAHSNVGASISSIYMNCNASTAMSKGCKNPTNESAELGTAAHALGEFCLNLNVNAYECVGMSFNGFTVDANMTEAVDLYVGYIKMLSAKYGIPAMLEKKVIMSSVGLHVFGTADSIHLTQRILHVSDYKHGYVVVNVENNTQAIFYCIATLDTYNLWDSVDKIITTIIQPRADHFQGSIREFEYTISELRAWQTKFYHAIRNPNNIPIAGKHCRYCLASTNCRARMNRTIELAYRITNINEVSVEELTEIFLEKDSIIAHINKITDKMTDEAKAGRSFEGLKLVQGRKHFVCTNESALIKEAGDKADKLYVKKLVSMSVAKNVVGKKIVDKYFDKPHGAAVLVSMSDSRPSVSQSAIGIFEGV